MTIYSTHYQPHILAQPPLPLLSLLLDLRGDWMDFFIDERARLFPENRVG